MRHKKQVKQEFLNVLYRQQINTQAYNYYEGNWNSRKVGTETGMETEKDRHQSYDHTKVTGIIQRHRPCRLVWHGLFSTFCLRGSATL